MSHTIRQPGETPPPTVERVTVKVLVYDSLGRVLVLWRSKGDERADLAGGSSRSRKHKDGTITFADPVNTAAREVKEETRGTLDRNSLELVSTDQLEVSPDEGPPYRWLFLVYRGIVHFRNGMPIVNPGEHRDYSWENVENLPTSLPPIYAEAARRGAGELAVAATVQEEAVS